MGVRLSIVAGEHLAEELQYEFDQERIAIGRGAGADVRIPHLSVSEAHATLRAEAEGYVIVDHGSTNGTCVNGARLPAGRKKRLSDGDRIDVGAYGLRFETGMLTARPTTTERTSELARRLFRHSLGHVNLGGPRLVLLTGTQTGQSLSIPPPPARLKVGSAEGCQLPIADPKLLPEHVEVIRDLDGVLIRTLDPAHPLRINTREVLERRLRDGDELVLGGTRLLFEDPAEESMDALTGEPDAPLSQPAATDPHPPISAPPPPGTPEPAPAAAAEAAAGSGATPRRSGAERSRSFDADLLVYTLALVIIAASVAGLIALMQAQ